MDKASIYIKKLLALLLCAVSYYFSWQFIKFYYTLPVGFLVYSFLSYKITGQKPLYLFNYSRSDKYLDKGGARSLLQIFLTLFGVIYDIAVWTFWGVYLVFDFIADVILLIKEIIFWILKSFLWFLKLYVPPIIILFNLLLYYLFRWPWWIYKTSAQNFKYIYNKNYIIISLIGSSIALLFVFTFYYLEIFLEIKNLFIIGVVLSLPPVSWSFGAITIIKQKQIQNNPFKEVKDQFQNGADTLRSVLVYITLFVFLLILQIILNFSGWIDNAGLTFTGITLTVNTFINIFLVILSVLIVLGTFIIPSFRLEYEFKETRLKDIVLLLRAIAGKLLKYIVSLIPGTFYGVIGIIIPSLFVALAFFTTIKVRDVVIDMKVDDLRQKQVNTNSETESHKLNNQVELLLYAKKLPHEILQDIKHRKNIEYEIRLYKEDIISAKEETVRYEQEQRAITRLISRDIQETTEPEELEALKQQKQEIEDNIYKIKAKSKITTEKLEADVNYLEKHKNQLPVLLYLWGFWCIVFIGFILSFFLAYLSNLFYDIYHLNDDKTAIYLVKQIQEQKKINSNQPLLGFSLLIATIIAGVILTFHFIDKTFIIPVNNWLNF